MICFLELVTRRFGRNVTMPSGRKRFRSCLGFATKLCPPSNKSPLSGLLKAGRSTSAIPRREGTRGSVVDCVQGSTSSSFRRTVSINITSWENRAANLASHNVQTQSLVDSSPFRRWHPLAGSSPPRGAVLVRQVVIDESSLV